MLFINPLRQMLEKVSCISAKAAQYKKTKNAGNQAIDESEHKSKNDSSVA